MYTLTQKRVEQFARDFGLEGDVATQFEYYVTSIHLYEYLADDVVAIEDTVLGGGEDEGIDAAAVIINGQIVREPSDIEELLADNEIYSNTAKVVFIQAKTSEKFDTKLISKFLHGVELVTRESMHPGKQDLPPRLKDLAQLIDVLAANLDKFDSVKIPCELIYQTTASHDAATAQNETQVKAALERIKSLGIYQDDLSLDLLGHERLSAKQQERLGPKRVQFSFEKRVTIPDDGVKGVKEAYIGVITAKAALQLLTEGGSVRPGIFAENVRLDLGAANPVNKEIGKTLSGSERGQFPFLNNGLTLVAKVLDNNGDRFFATGYQIINGGQTSHQLVRWSKSAEVQAAPELLDQVWIPVKIISTADIDLRRKTAVATNLQSAIGQVEIQSSLPKAIEVEEYFNESGSDGLRYERQTRERQLSFVRTRVVNTSELDRAVASVVFGDSAKAIGSPKELERENSYVWGDFPPEVFYFAALVIYRIDRFFARSPQYSSLKAAKYHLGMMVAAIVHPNLRSFYESADKERDQKRYLRSDQFVGLETDGRTYREIESAIPQAIEILESKYKTILDEGRSLRKDDVRSQTDQRELLQLVEERVPRT